MNRIRTGIMALLVLFVLVAPGIAQAKVVDQAGLFNASTISQLDQRIGAIKSTYGRDVLIVTVPSLGGRTIPQVAASFINVPVEQIGGVYIFIAKQEKKVDVAVGANTVNVIPPARKDEIKQQIIGQFKGGNYDQGILLGIGAIESDFRSAASVPTRSAPVTSAPVAERTEHRSGGFSFIWLLLIIVGVFIFINIIRSVMRGAGGGYGGGVPGGPGGPGYGGGYGGGYGAPGYGGGGGGFMSSLLGGVGGALAGNWLYDKFSGRGESTGGGYVDSSAAYTGGQPASSNDWTSSAAGTGWSSDGGSSWGTPDNSGSWGGSSDSGFGSSFGDSSSSGSWGGSDAGFGGSIDSGGGGGGGSDWS